MRVTEQLYHVLYKPYAPYGRYVCVYCGDSAGTRDHVPALATLAMMRAAGLPAPDPVLVPACMECNRLLSDVSVHDLGERGDYVRQRLRQKYQTLLAMPDWSEDELSEMGPTLAGVIRGDLVLRDKVRERLDWGQCDD